MLAVGRTRPLETPPLEGSMTWSVKVARGCLMVLVDLILSIELQGVKNDRHLDDDCHLWEERPALVLGVQDPM